MSKTVKNNKTGVDSKDQSSQIKITRIKSDIGIIPIQKKNLVGLGLSRINKPRILQNTPSIRGMINKVKHLVKYEII